MRSEYPICERNGAANLHCVQTSLYGFFDGNYEKLSKLASEMYDGSFCRMICDILDRGLYEVETIFAELDAQRSEEEHERSEKDCMWEGAE